MGDSRKVTLNDSSMHPASHVFCFLLHTNAYVNMQSLLGSLQSLLGLFKVDDFPDCLEVLN